MTIIFGLHEAVGSPAQQRFPDAEFLSSAEAQRDATLSALWAQDGWASYGKGLFRTVDPREFADLREKWDALPQDALVFACNAFADLFYLASGHVWYLDVQNAIVHDLGPNPFIFLNLSLADPVMNDSFLRRKLFRKLKATLGPLSAEECYGLFPAVPLGGDEKDSDSYRKAAMREYLDILSQLHE